MFQKTDDLRIRQVRPLIPPAILHEEIPISERASNVVAAARAAITNALKGQDQRLVVIAGPCSIHDAAAALEYGERLARLASRYADHLIVVMRAYFEKPRTSVGWKGLISTRASTSTRGFAWRGNCWLTSTISDCRRHQSFSICRFRSTSQT
jgi:3-deoxy-7-phosphoheptulonate synthase